ncbi:MULTISPECIES: hypothetical protein [unclassified Streptomyces]
MSTRWVALAVMPSRTNGAAAALSSSGMESPWPDVADDRVHHR